MTKISEHVGRDRVFREYDLFLRRFHRTDRCVDGTVQQRIGLYKDISWYKAAKDEHHGADFFEGTACSSCKLTRDPT